MNKEVAAEALKLYEEIYRIHILIKDVETPRRDRKWCSYLRGQFNDGHIGGLFEPSVFNLIVTHEDHDAALTPLFISRAKAEIALRIERLLAIGFEKPADCS